MSQQRFEGPTLEAVLADVTDQLGPEATIVQANRLRRGGLAGFFARERYEVLAGTGTPEARPDEADPPSTGNASTGRPVSTETSEFASLLDALIAQAGAEDDFGAATGTEPARVPAVPAAALARLGLPEELVTSVPAQIDPARYIAGLMEHAPRPGRLPRGRGTVVASVGERTAALALARDLATEMGIDPDDVVLASPNYRGRAVAAHRRLTDVEGADEQRRGWRRRPRPTVVAVEAAPGPPAAADWGRRVLDVLEPTMIWASVDATRKPEDITAWGDRLGGLDALAVTGLDQTESPAAVLRVGLPVGRLDGRPATPALWGALLAERFEAC